MALIVSICFDCICNFSASYPYRIDQFSLPSHSSITQCTQNINKTTTAPTESTITITKRKPPEHKYYVLTIMSVHTNTQKLLTYD